MEDKLKKPCDNCIVYPTCSIPLLKHFDECKEYKKYKIDELLQHVDYESYRVDYTILMNRCLDFDEEDKEKLKMVINNFKNKRKEKKKWKKVNKKKN